MAAVDLRVAADGESWADAATLLFAYHRETAVDVEAIAPDRPEEVWPPVRRETTHPPSVYSTYLIAYTLLASAAFNAAEHRNDRLLTTADPRNSSVLERRRGDHDGGGRDYRRRAISTGRPTWRGGHARRVASGHDMAAIRCPTIPGAMDGQATPTRVRGDPSTNERQRHVFHRSG